VPDLFLGSQIELVLGGNLQINTPIPHSVYLPGTDDLERKEPGAELTFIAIQDQVGGHALTFQDSGLQNGNFYTPNWTPNTAAGKINTITWRQSILQGQWVATETQVAP
jgi:hypothetical protein